MIGALRVKITLSVQGYRRGQIVELGYDEAMDLIDKGFAEIAPEP